MTTTTTTLTQLLSERLNLWDLIDQAYEQGYVSRAIELTQHVENDITPKIREGYGL